MLERRFYRGWAHNDGLITYTVTLRETDLRISTITDLSAEAYKLVRHYRRLLEEYIRRAPAFLASLLPLEVEVDAPAIVKDMAGAGQLAGVGPMAAVAGAIAQYVGKDLAGLSSELILENGGDIYLQSASRRLVSIFAGKSPLSNRLGIELLPGDTPVGVCTSSASVGPSLSFGHADAAVAVAPSAILADAAATAIGNTVKTPDDIDSGLSVAQGIPGLRGAVVIIGDRMGAWGDIKLVPVELSNLDS